MAKKWVVRESEIPRRGVMGTRGSPPKAGIGAGNVMGQLSQKEKDLIREAMTKLSPPNKSTLAPKRGQVARESELLRAAQKRMR